ncbi:hypothetical protein [Marinifilum sp. D737]|uniref:hypothetical protein n=1 Tax=Marinifilum sp. D737 TaxID=2969628 RepID=UPI0022732FFC|nr:hypothetical protein [Marinifilum sp. D737]MCY1635029.1 hypothetical protein [Marinifilum sp. D737]
MKKYQLNNFGLFLCFVVLILASCTAEFVPDPIDPRLPKYTEDGNNVAGAYVGDNIWESSVTIGFPYYASDKPSIKVWQEKDSLRLRFVGNVDKEQLAIEFHLTELGMIQFEDLINLNGQKISLDGTNNLAYLKANYLSSTNNKGIGQVYFRNVRHSKDKSSIIISGTFGFALSDYYEYPLKVRSGRFDYRIYETDFNPEEN